MSEREDADFLRLFRRLRDGRWFTHRMFAQGRQDAWQPIIGKNNNLSVQLYE